MPLRRQISCALGEVFNLCEALFLPLFLSLAGSLVRMASVNGSRSVVHLASGWW